MRSTQIRTHSIRRAHERQNLIEETNRILAEIQSDGDPSYLDDPAESEINPNVTYTLSLKITNWNEEQKNKIDYCRIHGIEIMYNMAHLDKELTAYWAKLSLIRRLMKKNIPWRVRFTGEVPHAKDIAQVIFNLGLPFSSSQEITNGCLLGVQKLTKCWQFQKILPSNHLSKARKGKYREALGTISQVKMMSARFRRGTKRARKSLRSKRLISQCCEVVFQLVVFGFHRNGKLQGGITALYKKAAKSSRNKRVISQRCAKFFL
uniref:Uncharacterized protein n=1 Tax=Vitis vinifera TaxID=29760 RepID=A5C8K9_VITVI|nr:hypothetical protein VITISV_003066 [Vitis vinifera]